MSCGELDNFEILYFSRQLHVIRDKATPAEIKNITTKPRKHPDIKFIIWFSLFPLLHIFAGRPRAILAARRRKLILKVWSVIGDSISANKLIHYERVALERYENSWDVCTIRDTFNGCLSTRFECSAFNAQCGSRTPERHLAVPRVLITIPTGFLNGSGGYRRQINKCYLCFERGANFHWKRASNNIYSIRVERILSITIFKSENITRSCAYLQIQVVSRRGFSRNH